VAIAGIDQALLAEQPNRLEQPMPTGGLVEINERLVDERGQHIAGRRFEAPTHSSGRVRGEPAGEDRQAP